MGIVSFRNKETEQLAQGLINKGTRRILPIELHAKVLIKIQILRSASGLRDLARFPGLRFEPLKGARVGEYSIRINRQYRICFEWLGEDASGVSIEDYH